MKDDDCSSERVDACLPRIFIFVSRSTRCVLTRGDVHTVPNVLIYIFATELLSFSNIDVNLDFEHDKE